MSTTTTVNVELLRRVLEHITAHPETWNQGVWAAGAKGCGTAYCAAGHAVVMTGHKIDWASAYDGVAEFVIDEGITNPAWHPTISEVAEAELGLTYEQAEELFEGDNTLAELWDLAEQFTDGAITPPADLPRGAE